MLRIMEMIDDFISDLFKRRTDIEVQKKAAEQRVGFEASLTPEYIEDMIIKAGREEVFARARLFGWHGPAPLFVWNAICQDILASRSGEGGGDRLWKV